MKRVRKITLTVLMLMGMGEMTLLCARENVPEETTSRVREVEGGYAFTIRDSNFDPQDYRQHVLSLGFRGEF